MSIRRDEEVQVETHIDEAAKGDCCPSDLAVRNMLGNARNIEQGRRETGSNNEIPYLSLIASVTSTAFSNHAPVISTCLLEVVFGY